MTLLFWIAGGFVGGSSVGISIGWLIPIIFSVADTFDGLEYQRS